MNYKLRDVDRQTFAAVCANSTSFAEICRRLDLAATSSAYPRIKSKAIAWNICLDHLKTGLAANAGRVFPQTRTTAARLLASGGSTNRGHLKMVLMREGLLVNRCALCPVEATWQGKPLVLRLDHINGARSDNRLENLRLICPNCDSQLPTFAGRNRK